MARKTFSIDFNHLTVIAIDEHGEVTDLNAEGEPCADLDDLREFVEELARQGAFGDYSTDEGAYFADEERHWLLDDIGQYELEAEADPEDGEVLLGTIETDEHGTGRLYYREGEREGEVVCRHRDGEDVAGEVADLDHACRKVVDWYDDPVWGLRTRQWDDDPAADDDSPARLMGWEAIEAATCEPDKWELWKHSDPIDGEREVTLEEAEQIAREDSSLIYAERC